LALRSEERQAMRWMDAIAHARGSKHFVDR
jgi:hypothetical protein